MSFSIRFVDSRNLAEDSTSCNGEIVIGLFTETFESSLTFWKKADYLSHWEQALRRFSEKTETCLITSIYDPEHANFLNWWLLYRSKNIVLFHNQILFPRDLGEPFNVANPYTAMPKYRRVGENGQPLSEWSISMDEVLEFLQRGPEAHDRTA